MTKLKYQSLQIFLLIFGVTSSLAQAYNLIDDGHNPNQHIEVLDPSGKYKLHWLVDWDAEKIFFNLTVETTGFIKFGISKDDPTSNPERHVDFIIGGVDINGEPYFTDRYSVGSEINVVDDSQDWELLAASQSGIFTFLSFTRGFDTGDSQDIPIDDNTLIVVWGYGVTDFWTESQHTSHGDIPMSLRNPDLTPLVIQGGRNTDYRRHIEGSDVKVWSIPAIFDIPKGRKTTYWCRLHKISLPKKHHIIGYTFNINNETKSNVHHMMLFYCRVPSPASVFEPFINHPGEECYSTVEPELKLPFTYCFMMKAGYSIGGTSVFFPDTMGVPIGETGETEYFMLQVHYDNPSGRGDLRSELTINAYYTEKLRPNDGGIFNIGHNVPGSPSLLLPPHLHDHRIHGDCSPDCTLKMLPSQGIKIVAVYLHAHNVGRKITARHFRGDLELPQIIGDDNWKFNYQPNRLLRNELAILPGDHFRITCHYYTSSLNQTTVGGYGTEQEMCNIFASYYTLLKEYPMCGSELISPTYAAHYLAGLKNVTWDRSKLEFVATEPQYLAGMSISEISDSNYVNWSGEQRAQLQRDHDNLTQLQICPKIAEVQHYARQGITPHCKSLEPIHFGDAPWCKNELKN